MSRTAGEPPPRIPAVPSRIFPLCARKRPGSFANFPPSYLYGGREKPVAAASEFFPRHFPRSREPICAPDESVGPGPCLPARSSLFSSRESSRERGARSRAIASSSNFNAAVSRYFEAALRFPCSFIRLELRRDGSSTAALGSWLYIAAEAHENIHHAAIDLLF